MAARPICRMCLTSLAAVLLFLSSSSLPAAAVDDSRSTPPNFVFILGEGQGWTSTSVQMDDAVPNSKSSFLRTSNFERLAREGLRLATFYAPSPRCTPSRASGMSPTCRCR